MLHIKWNAIEGRGFDTSECPYREPACQCRRSRLDPWVRKIPLEGNGNPLQYSSLGNPLDRGGWWATVHGLQRVRHDSACRHLLQDPVSRSLWEGGKPCNLIPQLDGSHFMPSQSPVNSCTPVLIFCWPDKYTHISRCASQKHIYAYTYIPMHILIFNLY